MSPLGIQYSECQDPILDHKHLAQDSMLHSCNEYCLGKVDSKGIKLRSCCFGFGTKQRQIWATLLEKNFARRQLLKRIIEELNI